MSYLDCYTLCYISLLSPVFNLQGTSSLSSHFFSYIYFILFLYCFMHLVHKHKIPFLFSNCHLRMFSCHHALHCFQKFFNVPPVSIDQMICKTLQRNMVSKEARVERRVMHNFFAEFMSHLKPNWSLSKPNELVFLCLNHFKPHRSFPKPNHMFFCVCVSKHK